MKPGQNTLTDLVLRPASREDVGLIFQLIKELAEVEGLSSIVTASEDSLRDSLFGQPRAAEVLLVSVGNQVIGYTIFFPIFSSYTGRPELFLRDLYIRAAFRGHGYGTQILRHICQLALERGAQRLEWYVSHSNQRAIDFYTKFGAELSGSIRVCRLEHAHLQQFVGRDV